ncbi:hypothetical protein [Streptomyces griseosporeus]|uniref:hypothetical protein n=1 Tax=Streptomyces griseosporeus TaxID=1910 RepID=UPI0036F9F1EE
MTAETAVTEGLPVMPPMSVGVRSWLGRTDTGEPIPCLISTYSALPFADAAPAEDPVPVGRPTGDVS